MTRRQSILTLGFTYIGTVIGAGFASGQEILQFFGRHGKMGILSVIISTILFCGLGANLLQLVYMNRLNSFDDFLGVYFSYKSRRFINYMMTLFLLIGYIVMLAGGGAILKALFSVNGIYGILIMSCICFATFLFGVNGIAKANNIIVPLLMVIVILFTGMIIFKNVFVFQYLFDNPLREMQLVYDHITAVLFLGDWGASIYLILGWLWSAILYVSFNSLVAIVVLSTLRPYIRDRKSAKYGGIIGGIGLGGMALLNN